MQRFLNSAEERDAAILTYAASDEMTMLRPKYECAVPKKRVLSEVADIRYLPIAALASTALARLRRRRYNGMRSARPT